ncbi:hypothetical protein ACPZ19_39365 [Amycolatopsis lurida]
MFIAGHGTTTNLIGNGTLVLIRHPAQREQFLAEPGIAVPPPPERPPPRVTGCACPSGSPCTTSTRARTARWSSSPGWMATTEFFGHQLTRFAGSHRVLSYDPRGQGRSEKHRRATTSPPAARTSTPSCAHSA